MPNLDSGRYFLTCMFPIRNGPFVNVEIEDDLSMPLLPVQMIRHMLSVGATAQQGPATYWEKTSDGGKKRAGKNSHFSKSFQTHFTRIFVIDNTIYNGRNPSDVIVDTLQGLTGKARKVKLIGKPLGWLFDKICKLPLIGPPFCRATSLLDPQEADQLSNPYLVWVAEIDAPLGKEEELDQYLADLWKLMPKKLVELFVHCHGFDAKTMNPENFIKFVRLGQVETVMPFNDYWQTTPELTGFFSTPQKWPLIATAAIGGFTTLVALAGAIYHLFKWQNDLAWWFWFFAISLVVTVVLAAFLGYRGIMKHGAKPFPMPPKSDLRSVLKSLYLQQQLTEFATTNQGCDAETLHQKFGTFLEKTTPKVNTGESQKPGTIRWEEGATS